MKPTHRRARLRAGLTCIVLVTLVACGPGGDAPVAEPAPTPEAAAPALTDRVELPGAVLDSLGLAYATVTEEALAPSVELPANLVAVPDRRATAGPRVAGRIAEVRVNVGDSVEADAVLLVLESETVGRAWADLIAARARADVARQALARQRRLLADRVTSERAAEEAEGALLVADADLRAATTRLSTFGVEPGETPPDDPTRVAVRSPLGGTVVARRASLGQWAEPAETLVEVIDLDAVWLEATAYERDLRLIAVGQRVQVEVRAFPEERFAGTVSQVASTLDPVTRTATVRVELPNPDGRLRPGMFATARIAGVHEHEPRRLLAMPWAAVQQIDDHRAVFVRVAGGAFELRRVHTGERAGDLVEVLNGLQPGAVVVTEGSFLLKSHLLRSTLGEAEEGH